MHATPSALDPVASVRAIANTMAADVAAIPRPRFPWHVVLTHPGQDRQAVEALRRRRYRVYRPVLVLERHLRGRRVLSERSLFPGYIFALPHRDGWEPLRESPGVYDLMRMNDRYVTLWDDDPDFRRIEAVEIELRNMPQKSAKFRVGQRVKLTKGPFVEFFGTISALDDTGRAGVLIELLKRKVRVSCSIDQMNPA